MSLRFGIPLLLVLAVLQATVFPHLRIFGGQPDLILIVVIAWTILNRDQEAMVWAFTGGLFLDMLSGTPVGISSLIMTLMAFAIGLTEAQIYRAGIGLPLLITLGGSLFYHVAYIVLMNVVTGYPTNWGAVLPYVTLPSILFDIILILPALYLLTPWYKRLHPRQISTL